MKAKRIYFVSALSLFAILASATTTLGSEGGGEQSTLFTGDLGNIVWTLITFFVVLGVLGKFAWGPIMSALQKWEDFIRDSLTQAKREREDAGQQLKEYTEKLVGARAEATAHVEEGRREAEGP